MVKFGDIALISTAVKSLKETPVFGRNEALRHPAIILEHLDFVTENEYPPKNLP